MNYTYLEIMDKLNLRSKSIITRTLDRYKQTGDIEYEFYKRGSDKIELKHPEIEVYIQDAIEDNRHIGVR